MNTYLTIHDYLREVTGQETTSLVGNLFKVSTGGVSQGATSLPATPVTTVQLNINDPITMFDGSSSEVAYVTATTAAGASSIPVTALQFNHTAGTSCASDGRLGSLAEAIVEGSAEVERICRQPLLQATYSETLPLLTTRAVVDNTSALLVRPRQAPIQSVSALTIQFSINNVMTVDTGQVVINSTGKLVKVPVIRASGASNNYQILQYISPTITGDVLITYTAGYAYASLPIEVHRAASMLVSDILSDRINPTGAAQLQTGKMNNIAYLRGDLTGETALVKRARKKLLPYIMETW